MLTLDPNRQTNSFTPSIAGSSSLRRIVDVALPFLSLHAPTARVISAGLALLQTGVHLHAGYKSILEGNYQACAQSMALVAFQTSLAALSILMPAAHYLLSQGHHTLTQSGALLKALSRRDWKESQLLTLSLVNQSIHISSLLIGGPELILFSITCQVVKDLYKAQQAWGKGQKPEAFLALGLGLIRLALAKALIVDLHHDYFSARLTKEIFSEICNSKKPATPFSSDAVNVDLEQELLNRGLSRHIHDLDFGYKNFPNLIVKNIRFYNCKFGGGSFLNSLWENVQLYGCQFGNSLFRSATLNRVSFENCQFSSTNFTEASLRFTRFFNCKINNGDFRGAKFDFVRFVESNFNNCSLDFSESIQRSLQIIHSTFKSHWLSLEGISSSNVGPLQIIHEGILRLPTQLTAAVTALGSYCPSLSVSGLDASRQVDVLTSDIPISGPAKRIIDLCLPMLSLHAPTAQIFSLGMGLLQTATQAELVVKALREHKLRNGAHAFALTMLYTSSVALSILSPAAQYLFSQSYQALTQSISLTKALYNREWKEAGLLVGSLLNQGVHVSSLLFAAPELMALSLILQIFKELYSAYQARNQGQIPEMALSLFLALLKARQAKPIMTDLRRDYFGPRLTRELLGELFTSARQKAWAQFQYNADFDLEKELKLNGLSRHIYDVDFTDLNTNDNQPKFVVKNIRFFDCKFDGSNLNKSLWENVRITSCSFQDTLWIEASLKNVTFNRANLLKAFLFRADIQNTSLSFCELKQAKFVESCLANVRIFQSGLIETSFLFAKVKQATLENCDLTDTLLLNATGKINTVNCSKNQFTRPVVVVAMPGGRLRFAPYNMKALDDQKTISVNVSAMSDDINPNALDEEVRCGLEHLPESYLSRGDALLEQAPPGSQMALTLSKFRSLMPHVDGLALLGGNDIEPELYGASRITETHTHDDFRRSITELALIKAAHELHLPIMGTCRGSQMLNIYFGGTLHQNVPDQWFRYQNLNIKPSPYEDWATSHLGPRFISMSAHHQAADKIGNGLEIVLERDNIPKLLMNDKIIASQVHPEIYCNESTKNDLSVIIKRENLDISIDEILESNREIYSLFRRRLQQQLEDRLAQNIAKENTRTLLI
jgi:putative glutamine amidotransferase